MKVEFSEKQLAKKAKRMHSEVHKLLVYCDPKITDKVFESDDEFVAYFENLICRFGGMNEILGEPDHMIDMISTLQAALDEFQGDSFRYSRFRRLILDAHGYLTEIFGEYSDGS